MTTSTELRRRISRQADIILDLQDKLATAQRQNEALYQACEALVDLAIFMSGSADFSEGGDGREGWLKMRGAIDKGKYALRLVRAASDPIQPGDTVIIHSTDGDTVAIWPDTLINYDLSTKHESDEATTEKETD